MNDKDIESAVRSSVIVTRQQVTIAKAISLDSAENKSSPQVLISKVTEKNGVKLPRPVTFSNENYTEAIKTVSTYLSWHIATCEAIWGLMHAGLLFGYGEWRDSDLSSVHWTRASSGSSSSSTWNFEEFSLCVPLSLVCAFSSKSDQNYILAEPGLYLRTLDVPDMHADVEASFVEAVRCFRSELYTASIAMLGRASEGSWLELGDALLNYLPATTTKKYAKQREVLESPMAGPQKKVAAVLEMYEHRDDFSAIWERANVRSLDLKSVATWSDSVRDSRNTIHFGVAPAIPNTYEKLAALLIGAVPMIRTIYRVKCAADSLAP